MSNEKLIIIFPNLANHTQLQTIKTEQYLKVFHTGLTNLNRIKKKLTESYQEIYLKNK